MLTNEESIFWKLSEKTDFWDEKLYTCKRKYSVTSIPPPHEQIRVTLKLTLSEFMLSYINCFQGHDGSFSSTESWTENKEVSCVSLTLELSNAWIDSGVLVSGLYSLYLSIQ